MLCVMRFEFDSRVFERELVDFGLDREYIVRGGRDRFGLLPRAFAGIGQIGVIGWGSQGPAQAQNLRDSLHAAGSDIRVCVGLREGSSSWAAAEAAGFSAHNGGLGEMFGVIAESDLVILLISDAAQVELYPQVFAAMKPGATLGLSHGFLLGHLQSVGETWPAGINVIGVCPKGMGPSVRRLYLQGAEVGGAGINASFAVEQDLDGHATDYAIGWAVAIGAPFSFMTTLEMEYRSDIYGERGVLLGGVHGMAEALYRWFLVGGMSPEEAFAASAETITGPLSRTISHSGIRAVYETMDPARQAEFARAYSAAYPACREVLLEIYDEVSSGNEIRSVVMAGKRLGRMPMRSLDDTPMWQVGQRVRAARDTISASPHPVTAGVYCALMIAQCDILLEHGHAVSEVVNESVIEAVDSLNPFMHYRGVSWMVDNCSVTARLGARKWAPRFDYLLSQLALPALDRGAATNEGLMQDFLNHGVHRALSVAAELRPTVDIALTGAEGTAAAVAVGTAEGR